MIKYFIRFAVAVLVAVGLYFAFDHREKEKNHLRYEHETLDDLDLLEQGDQFYVISDDHRVVSCHRRFVEDGGWHGECDGGLDANFIQRYDATTGKAATFGSFQTTGNRICKMAPDAQGESTVQCVSEDEIETDEEAHLDVTTLFEYDDEPTHQRKLDALNLTFAMGHVDYSNRRRLYDDSGFIIDLLVVWTRLAECINSNLPEDCQVTPQTTANMRGLIDLAMTETNSAFSMSWINTRLRLVYAYRDDYYEEPTAESPTVVWNNMVWHLTNADDGELDSVHVKRALYGADLVHMIAGSRGTCGLSRIGPDPTKVFSVSRGICATGHYSFGHEIAHTMGTHHDRASLKRCDSHQDQYNFGYRDPEAQFRTIMSYSCRTDQCDNLPNGPCPRIQRFSNSAATFNGKPLGDVTSDNALIINQNRQLIAKFSPAMDCLADSECDDGDASTLNTCNVEKGICVFSPATDTSVHSMSNPSKAPIASVSTTNSPFTNPSAGPSPAPSTMMPRSVPASSPNSSLLGVPVLVPSGPQSAAPMTRPTMLPRQADRIDSFVLVYAPTNAELLELNDGAVIDIRTLDGVTELAFNVKVNPSSGTEVVFFPQTGRRERSLPLAFCGDYFGNYFVCSEIKAGINTIEAAPIDAVSNLQLPSISITFELVGAPSRP